MSIPTERFSIIGKPIKKEHVVKALDKQRGKTVWLKYASSSSKNILMEYEAINRVDSEYIVEATEFSIADDTAFIVLEDAGKNDLQKVLRNERRKDVLFSLTRQLITAYCEIEYAGVLYRDLMDSHILVSNNKAIKLIDFNNILFAEQDSTYINKSIAGFYKTMAPEEHIESACLKNSNVYTLCCMIYRIFHGHYPIDQIASRYTTTPDLLCSDDYKSLNKALLPSKLLSKQQNNLLVQCLNYQANLRLENAAILLKEFFGEEFNISARDDYSYWSIDENIAVSQRPGFYSKRIFRKNSSAEINSFYERMGDLFPVCLCLLTRKEKDYFCNAEEYRKIGNKYFNQYIEFELSSKPHYNEDIKNLIERLHSILSSGQKVLIHCNAGIGRACTIAICLLIKRKSVNGADIHIDSIIRQTSANRTIESVLENKEQTELIAAFYAEV